MKILAGINSFSQGKTLVRAIHDLGFPELKLELVTVVEVWTDSVTTHYPLGSETYTLKDYFNQVAEEARGTLALVQEEAERLGMGKCQTQVLYGNISNAIMVCADERNVDLIALGSWEKGHLEGIFLGSVGRKAVINSRHSILIIKDNWNAAEGLSTVIATDHSPYANKCINRWIEWRPRGIARMTVLTVIPDKFEKSQLTASKYLKADTPKIIRDGLSHENEQLLEKLTGLGARCESRVEVGDVGDTIELVMQESRSNLLILGSQGHGFMERMRLGSISLEQAIKKPYSVLIVRG